MTIDATSPAGSWRAALQPNAWCRACGQQQCACSDAEYAGVVPPRNAAAPARADGCEARRGVGEYAPAASEIEQVHGGPTSREARRDHA